MSWSLHGVVATYHMVGVYDVMKPVWWPPIMGCMVSESLRGVVATYHMVGDV